MEFEKSASSQNNKKTKSENVIVFVFVFVFRFCLFFFCLSLYYKMFSCDERKRGLCQNYILSQNAKNERKEKKHSEIKNSDQQKTFLWHFPNLLMFSIFDVYHQIKSWFSFKFKRNLNYLLYRILFHIFIRYKINFTC